MSGHKAGCVLALPEREFPRKGFSVLLSPLDMQYTEDLNNIIAKRCLHISPR